MQGKNRTNGHESQTAKRRDGTSLTPRGFTGVVGTMGFEGIHSDSFVVMVVGQERCHSITFHHPIGITGLNEDAYVATPSEDVRLLELRKDDPRRAPIRAKREKEYQAIYAAQTAGIIVVNGDLFIEEGNIDISRTVTHWSMNAEIEWTKRNPVPLLTHEELARSTAKRQRLELLKMPKSFPEQLAAAEGEYTPLQKCYHHIRAYNAWKWSTESDAAMAAVDADNPFPPYETGGGSSGDRPQHAAAFLAGQTNGPGPCIDFLLTFMTTEVSEVMGQNNLNPRCAESE